jgi:hypothetical protein
MAKCSRERAKVCRQTAPAYSDGARTALVISAENDH